MRLHPRDMTSGQLKIHYGAVCQHHGVDGVKAIGRVHRFDTERLRGALCAYEDAAAKEDWTAAEDALLSLEK